MGKSRQRNKSTSSTDSDVKNRKHKHNGNKHSTNHIDKQRNGTSNNNSLAGEKWTHGQLAPIFPSFTPFVVFIVTLALRVDYVTRRENWWMVHPDEVYQSIEVAHIETYGYGFRTYDFSPPESLDDATMYRQMQLKTDMYGLRSPIFPYYYVIVSYLTSLVGYNPNPYLLWRVAHVFITSLLPLAVYRYVLRLFKSSDTASVASILVASSVHLSVFGTHNFLHSFLAPFTFLALALLVDVFSDEGDSDYATDCNGDRPNEISSASTANMISANNWTKRIYLNGQIEDVANNNVVSGDILKNCPNSYNDKLSLSFMQEGTANLMFKKTSMNGKMTNGINNYECEAFGQNKIKASVSKFGTSSRVFTAGFLSALTCYIRPDVILVYCANIILFLTLKVKWSLTKLVIFVIGISCAVLAGLASDFCFYGWGVISPINWVNFNAIKNMSAIIFGKMSSLMYVSEFFLHDIGILFISIFSIVGCIVLFFKQKCHNFNKSQTEDAAGSVRCHNEEFSYKDRNHASMCFKLFLMWAFLLGVYSMNEHKEMRFIHDVIILLFVFIASVVVGFRSLLKSTTFSNNVILLMIAVFVFTQWQAFPNHKNNMNWIYQKTKNVQDVNACIEFIASQNDVTGVFYDSNLHMTGAMSLLHHDVTIMSLMVGGFYEFGPRSRKNQSHDAQSSHINNNKMGDQKPPLLKPRRTSVNEFTSASNYIAVANAPAAARIIIQNPKIYNYIVLKRGRKFLDDGFQAVFAFGGSHVLKRLLDKESEKKITTMLERIPLSNNATVMLHEGDVLFHMSQYQEASTRFNRAIELNDKILEAYMPLQICYSKMGDRKAAKKVKGKCEALFGEKACATVRRITPL